MKKNALFVLILISLLLNVSAQNPNKYYDFSERGEVYFSFQIENFDILNQLTRIISIDNVEENGTVIAYANEEEFLKFLEFGFEPTILTAPSMLEEHIMMRLEEYRSKTTRNEWNSYPSYETYLAMMDDFENNFPHLCEIVDFGRSVQNRKLLAAKVTGPSDIIGKTGIPQGKVKIHLSSTMHGDETTGYVLMLRLVDYLLNNYATDNRIKNMLDNAEIWIVPNANPDGTYRTGNSNVTGAIRGNANNRDLNRNYKDSETGDNPDGPYQAETLAFKAFQAEQKFHLGMNIHGGIELVNYPWDNIYARHADDAWWRMISQEYVDTARAQNSNYMRGLTTGITNGADWYIVYGSRQDYANYFDLCREVTLEISNTKMPNASNMPNFWNWNYRSFLNFIEQGLYGIHGTVTDAANGLPVKAKIEILGHDKRNTHIFSDTNTGYYARPIKGGTYTLTYSAEGYGTQNRTITITDKQRIIQDVALNPYDNDTTSSIFKTVENTDVSIIVYPNPAKDIVYIEAKSTIKKVELVDMTGKQLLLQISNYDKITLNTAGIMPGIYLVRVHFDDGFTTSKIMIFE